MIGIVLFIAFTANWEQLTEAFFNLDVAARMFPRVITVGLANTLLYTVCAFAFGLLVGINMIFGGAALIAMSLHARKGAA